MDSDSLNALTDLLHRAYKPLLDSGFNYSAADQTNDVTQACIEGGECYVAVQGPDLVGTILLLHDGRRTKCELYNRADTAHFGKFAVEPSLQEGGIGLALMTTVEKRASELGYKWLACDTAEGAAELVQFYQRHNYQIVERVHWEGKTYWSVVMRKNVAASEEPVSLP